MLTNLLHNAVKFSADGGFVDVTAALSNEEATISVRDYGPGIDAAVRASLFERYRQAARTAHQGTGLGLFIAKSIAEAHGGGIDVESSPGNGACFVLRFPAAEARADAVNAPS